MGVGRVACRRAVPEGGSVRDPAHISLAAWNQEHPYGDFCGYDLEQDQRWDYVAGSDYVPRELPPTRVPHLGAVPAPADCQGNSPSDAAGYPAGGVPSSS